jgi:hypothetical protein
LRKYKKVFAFRLEIREAEWLDMRIHTSKTSISTVMRNLIRDKIALEATVSKTALPTNTPKLNPSFGGRTAEEWIALNKLSQEEVPQP